MYTRPDYITERHYRFYIIDQRKFNKLYDHYSYMDKSTTAQIYYNKHSGVGYANQQRFKFKNDQPEFPVFGELYGNINKLLGRKSVLGLSKYKDSGTNKDLDVKLRKNVGKKKIDYTSATYFINKLAKKIRKRTGLNTDQLAVNNGDMVLVGKKLKEPPKLPQT